MYINMIELSTDYAYGIDRVLHTFFKTVTMMHLVVLAQSCSVSKNLSQPTTSLETDYTIYGNLD